MTSSSRRSFKRFSFALGSTRLWAFAVLCFDPSHSHKLALYSVFCCLSVISRSLFQKSGETVCALSLSAHRVDHSYVSCQLDLLVVGRTLN